MEEESSLFSLAFWLLGRSPEGGIILGVALATLPGWLVLWWGRSLRRAAEDPLLPERLAAHRRRVALVLVGCAGAAVWLARGMIVPLIAIAVLSVIVADFPTRRALFGETWSLRAYLSFTVRLLLAFAGFWLLPMTAPMLLLHSGSLMIPVAILLAVLLLLWRARYAPAFVWLTRARVFDHVDLRDRFTAIHAKARVPPPQIYEFDPGGGRWINAVALPSLRRPSVVFSSSLLRLFEQDEVAAVYAHELAHIEHYTPARLRRSRAATLALIAASIALPFYLLSAIPSWAGACASLWFAMIFLFYVSRASGRRAHETESDLRAVELCGDPEALARALIKLHALNFQPRRWDPDVERRATHPSLARRLQAIRRAGAVAAAKPPDALPPPAGPPPTTPLIVGAPSPALVLASDRIHVLTGVPADAPREMPLVLECADSVEAAPYNELTELRIAAPAGMKGGALLVWSGPGRSGKVRLAPDEVARVQRYLDSVDLHLAAPRRAKSDLTAWTAIFAFAVLVGSIYLGKTSPLVIFGALLVVLRRGPAPTAALGVVSVVLALAGSPTRSLAVSLPGSTSAPWAMALIGIGLVLVAAREWRVDLPRRTRGRLAATILMGLFTLPSLVTVLANAGSGLAALHQTLSYTTATPAGLLGLAAALAFFSTRLARASAIAAGTAGCLLISLGSTWVLDRYSTDPLIPRGAPSFVVHAGTLVKQWSTSVSASVGDLRASPDGRVVAVTIYDRTRPDDPVRFTLFDSHGAKRVVPCTDLDLLPDGTTLALASRDEGTILTRADSAGVRIEEWRLPGTGPIRLLVDGGKWVVLAAGRDFSGLVHWSGQAGDRETRASRFPLDMQRDFGPFVASGEAMARLGYGERTPGMGLLLLGRAMQTRLHLRSLDGKVNRVVESALTVHLFDALPGQDRIHLHVWDGSRLALWEVSSAGVLTCAGVLPAGQDDWLGGHPQHEVTMDGEGMVFIADSRSKSARRFRLSENGLSAREIVMAGPYLAILHSRASGHSAVTVYSVGSR